MNKTHLFWIIGLISVATIMYIISRDGTKTQTQQKNIVTEIKNVGYKEKFTSPQKHEKKINKTPPSVKVEKKRAEPIYIFIDIAKQDFLKDPYIGRIVFELYPEHAPKTVKNFVELCNQKKYVNTPFHRIIQGFMIQGGDIVNQDGSGTYSIYGGEGSMFEDEEFILKHDKAGCLSMANSGKNTNGSQFFITVQPTPHLDGKHVVFGKVIDGIEFVYELEKEITDSSDRPIRKCYISNCGLWDKKNKPITKTNNLIELNNTQETNFDNNLPNQFQL